MLKQDHHSRNIHLGLATIPWFATEEGWLDFTREFAPEYLLEQVKKAGFEGTPLQVPEGWSVERYQTLLNDVGVQPAPGYFDVCLPEQGVEQADVVEGAKALAGVHAALGLHDMFIGASWFADSPRVRYPAQGRDADTSRLGRLTELFGVVSSASVEEGVRPMLHPHVGTWIETEHEARSLLDALGGQLLGFGPDIGHIAWSGADVVKMVRDYSDRIGGVHFKDCRVSIAAKAREAGLTYQQTALQGLWAEPGRGELPLESILDALPEDFGGWVIAEVDRPDVDSDPFESAKVSAEWLVEHVRGGKKRN
jgi:inosose dehydratase